MTLTMLVLAGALGVRAWPVAHGARATGEIVDFRNNNDEQQSSAPIVRFTASKGTKPVTFTSDSGTKPGDKLGDEVPVRYVVDDPQGAAIDRFFDLWLLPVIFTGIAVLLALLAFGI